MTERRIICWWSAGASAVTAKIAQAHYGEVTIAYCASTQSTEHPGEEIDET